MNVESFENEIAKLESQLQDAIAALRVLPDIQATFQDMQPRYERLRQLTDAAAGLPEHYAQQFETARQQAESRLAQLEKQLRQQQTRWEVTLNELQQQTDRSLAELGQQIEIQKIELQHAIIVLNERASSASANLKAFIEKELQDQARQLREEFTRQFQKAVLTGLLGGAVALGTLVMVLFR